MHFAVRSITVAWQISAGITLGPKLECLGPVMQNQLATTTSQTEWDAMKKTERSSKVEAANAFAGIVKTHTKDSMDNLYGDTPRPDRGCLAGCDGEPSPQSPGGTHEPPSPHGGEATAFPFPGSPRSPPSRAGEPSPERSPIHSANGIDAPGETPRTPAPGAAPATAGSPNERAPGSPCRRRRGRTTARTPRGPAQPSRRHSTRTPRSPRAEEPAPRYPTEQLDNHRQKLLALAETSTVTESQKQKARSRYLFYLECGGNPDFNIKSGGPFRNKKDAYELILNRVLAGDSVYYWTERLVNQFLLPILVDEKDRKKYLLEKRENGSDDPKDYLSEEDALNIIKDEITEEMGLACQIDNEFQEVKNHGWTLKLIEARLPIAKQEHELRQREQELRSKGIESKILDMRLMYVKHVQELLRKADLPNTRLNALKQIKIWLSKQNPKPSVSQHGHWTLADLERAIRSEPK